MVTMGDTVFGKAANGLPLFLIALAVVSWAGLARLMWVLVFVADGDGRHALLKAVEIANAVEAHAIHLEDVLDHIGDESLFVFA